MCVRMRVDALCVHPEMLSYIFLSCVLKGWVVGSGGVWGGGQLGGWINEPGTRVLLDPRCPH